LTYQQFSYGHLNYRYEILIDSVAAKQTGVYVNFKISFTTYDRFNVPVHNNINMHFSAHPNPQHHNLSHIKFDGDFTSGHQCQYHYFFDTTTNQYIINVISLNQYTVHEDLYAYVSSFLPTLGVYLDAGIINDYTIIIQIIMDTIGYMLNTIISYAIDNQIQILKQFLEMYNPYKGYRSNLPVEPVIMTTPPQGPIKFRNKYLKYKQKYLELKKMIN